MGVRINTLAKNRYECPRNPEPVVFSATTVGIIVAGVVVSIILGAILIGLVWQKYGRRRIGQFAVQRNSSVRGSGRPSREKYEELQGDMKMSLLNVGRTSGQTDRVAHETDVDANGLDVSGVTRFGSGSGPTVVSAPRSSKYDVPTPSGKADDGNLKA